MNESDFVQLIEQIDRAFMTAFSVAPETDKSLENLEQMLRYTYGVDRLKYLRDQVEAGSALTP